MLMQGQPFDFDRYSVQFNSFYGASGAISFVGTWPFNQTRYKLTMIPQQDAAQVTALADNLMTMSEDQSEDMILESPAGMQTVVQHECCSLRQYIHLMCLSSMSVLACTHLRMPFSKCIHANSATVLYIYERFYPLQSNQHFVTHVCIELRSCVCVSHVPRYFTVKHALQGGHWALHLDSASLQLHEAVFS